MKNALEYWKDEIALKAEGTKENYTRYFQDFLTYLSRPEIYNRPITADEILEQRIQDCTNTNQQIRHRFESHFRTFLATMKKEREYEGGTLQSIYASIRSFFECHYYPLQMRKKDYPKASPNGVRRATKEAILKILAENDTRITAMIHTANDTGLGVSDLAKLNCNIILENTNTELIMITGKRIKTGDLYKTYLADESITALKNYIQQRQQGTRKIPPEQITNNSPLFTTKKGKRISRTNISNIIEHAFQRQGEKHMSAHSLRKKLQTDLEKGGMPTNWIDLILGHQLINSRDAYSLPTDEELQEAYEKAYPHIRIYPEMKKIHTTRKPTQQTETNADVQEAHDIKEIKALLAKGYKYEMDFDGVKLFIKKYNIIDRNTM